MPVTARQGNSTGATAPAAPIAGEPLRSLPGRPNSSIAASTSAAGAAGVFLLRTDLSGVSRRADGYVDQLDFTCMMNQLGTPELAGTFPSGDASANQRGCKIGTFGGTLKDVIAARLGSITMKEAVKRAGIDPAMIDDVRFGCCMDPADTLNVTRVAALLAGIPDTVTAVTVNRVCISGMEAVLSGAAMIQAGMADIILAGGVEHMSGVPYISPDARLACSNSMRPNCSTFPSGMVSLVPPRHKQPMTAPSALRTGAAQPSAPKPEAGNAICRSLSTLKMQPFPAT